MLNILMRRRGPYRIKVDTYQSMWKKYLITFYWKVYEGMDFVGEVLAQFLGLTSNHQSVFFLQTRQIEEEMQRKVNKRQRVRLHLQELLQVEQRKLNKLERGAI